MAEPGLYGMDDVMIEDKSSVPQSDAVERNLDHEGWKDVPFAVGYYLSLSFSFILGIYLVMNIDDTSSTNSAYKFNFLQIFVAVLSGTVFTFVWLALVLRFAECIIKTSLIATPIVLGLVAIITMFSSVVSGFILLLFAFFSAWYAYAVWNRVEFAVACLKVVISVFKQLPSPLLFNLLMAAASIVILVFDFMIFVAVAYSAQTAGAQGFIIFLLYALIYWHNIVTINVAHVTACSVMGAWLYNRSLDNVSLSSFKRAITTSFGSICFGALIEAVVRALSALLRHLERNAENQCTMIVLCCLRCLINLIADIISYINSYAFVFVALYQESYLESAKDCWNMFKTRGCEAIVNDDLTTIPLYLGAMFLVCVVVVVGMVVDGLSANVLIAITFALVIYFCSVYTLISYTKTLYVVWINDPASFKSNRPEEFAQIVEAAQNFGYDTNWVYSNQAYRGKPAAV